MARYGCTITVQTGEMPSTQTNFSWVAVTANFPTAAIDGGAQSIDNNGGNLRCYTDDTKATRLSIEVVDFTTGGSPSIVIWGLSASLGVGGTVYIEGDTVAISQPAPSATYGSEDVWPNHAMAAHTESASLIDSTGNDTISAQGAITTGGTGAIGDGIAFSAATIGITKDTNAGVNFTSGYTFSVWATITGDTNYAGFLRNSGMQIIKDKDLPNLRVEHDDGTTSTRAVIPNGYSNLVVFNARHRYTLTWDGSTFSSYRDDVLIDTISQTRGVSVTGLTAFMYEVGNPPGFTTSLYDESFVRNGHSSGDLVSSEYNNQNNTAAFWSTSAWEDQDAGGAQTLSPVGIISSEAFGTAVIVNRRVISPTGVASAETWGTPEIVQPAQVLSPTGMPTGEVWGNPDVLVLLQILVAQGIQSEEEWGSVLVVGGDAVVIPIIDRATYNKIAEFLRSQSFRGQDNEVILKWLLNEGYIGQFNEVLNDYLGGLSYVGSLQDRFARWRDE